MGNISIKRLLIFFLFAVASVILLIFLLTVVFSGLLQKEISMAIFFLSIIFYIFAFVLIFKNQLKTYKIYTFMFVVTCLLLFLQVAFLFDFISLPNFYEIDINSASSTLTSILNFSGPLLGLFVALLIFFYKSLDDRKNSYEKELLDLAKEPSTSKGIIEELTRRVSDLRTEARHIRVQITYMFFIFVIAWLVCVINQNFLSAELSISPWRLIIPISLIVMSILSILPLVSSFHGHLDTIHIFSASKKPVSAIEEARRVLNMNPFESMLICFYTIEKATEQFLSNYFELPKPVTHEYIILKMRKISPNLANDFKNLSKIRDKIVVRAIIPTSEMAADYIQSSADFLKQLTDFKDDKLTKGRMLPNGK
jgi:hypothetical protein